MKKKQITTIRNKINKIIKENDIEVTISLKDSLKYSDEKKSEAKELFKELNLTYVDDNKITPER